MIWTDIIIENMIPDRQICFILQKLLNIPSDKIQVIGDYDDFPTINTMIAVCQKSIFKAGFVMMLSIYLFGKITKNIPSIDDFALNFSLLSNSRCLIPTDDVNPNQMYLFEGSKKEIIFIDENRLENEGQYFICEYMPQRGGTRLSDLNY